MMIDFSSNSFPKLNDLFFSDKSLYILAKLLMNLTQTRQIHITFVISEIYNIYIFIKWNISVQWGKTIHRLLWKYNLMFLKHAGLHPFRAVTFMNISAGYLTLQIFSIWLKVNQCLWSILGILGQDGHSVIRLSHLVVARRLLRLVGTLISLSPPVSITLFRVSYWSTSGQKSHVYFLFFLTANFWGKIEFDAQGQDGKLSKIAYFPPIQRCHFFFNEWQNKISVGDAVLGSKPCNLELINSCLQYECEHWKSVSDCTICISLIWLNSKYNLPPLWMNEWMACVHGMWSKTSNIMKCCVMFFAVMTAHVQWLAKSSQILLKHTRDVLKCVLLEA